MIPFSIFLYVLIVHWVADFVLQTHEQAINKATSAYYLNCHVLTYSFVWLFAACGLFERGNDIIIFTLFTYVSHFITDFFTSKASGYFFKIKQDYHNGFVVVGFDQIIHYVTLFGSYLYLHG